MTGFCLWSEPWIPVETCDGAAVKVSLSQALSDAHSLRGILDPSPLITVALHRLLLALLYRTHPLDNFGDWQRLWREGSFDATPIAAYGKRMAERFDLLHRTRPFYQVPALPEEKVHPVAALLLEASSGHNPALFDHGLVEGSQELPLDRAACYLLAHQLFAIGGGVSKPFNRMDAPLTKGIVVEVMGRTLFETLMFNAIPFQQWEQLAPPTSDDAPFWEEDSPPEPVKEGTSVRGPLHYLTWQSRRVHLVVDRERQMVTGCQIAQRYCLPKDGSQVDPGKAYLRDKEKGWRPRKLQKDRAAWRLTHVLLQPTEEDHAQPAVVSWLSALRQRQRMGQVELPATVSLAVSGLTTDPSGKAAKIDLWRREEIGLPLAILEEPSLVREINRMMTMAARIESHLRRTGEALVWAMAERQHQREALHYLWTGKADAKMPPSVPPVAQSLGLILRYWAAMEGPFRAALWHLPEEDITGVRASWHRALKRNAWAAMGNILEGLRAGGAPWEPLSLVEDAFGRRLTRLLRDEEEVGDGDSHEDGDNE